MTEALDALISWHHTEEKRMFSSNISLIFICLAWQILSYQRSERSWRKNQTGRLIPEEQLYMPGEHAKFCHHPADYVACRDAVCDQFWKEFHFHLQTVSKHGFMAVARTLWIAAGCVLRGVGEETQDVRRKTLCSH